MMVSNHHYYYEVGHDKPCLSKHRPMILPSICPPLSIISHYLPMFYQCFAHVLPMILPSISPSSTTMISPSSSPSSIFAHPFPHNSHHSSTHPLPHQHNSHHLPINPSGFPSSSPFTSRPSATSGGLFSPFRRFGKGSREGSGNARRLPWNVQTWKPPLEDGCGTRLHVWVPTMGKLGLGRG